MATEIKNENGTLIGYQLEHTAQQVDNTVDDAMRKSNYDPDDVVALAGGIPAYLAEILNTLNGEEDCY